MTGENFLRLNRGGCIKEMKEKLQAYKEAFWEKAKENDYSADYYSFEQEIKRMEYEIWCEEYERDRLARR
jgi:hypothetical protein